MEEKLDSNREGREAFPLAKDEADSPIPGWW